MAINVTNNCYQFRLDNYTSGCYDDLEYCVKQAVHAYHHKYGHYSRYADCGVTFLSKTLPIIDCATLEDIATHWNELN